MGYKEVEKYLIKKWCTLKIRFCNLNIRKS